MSTGLPKGPKPRPAAERFAAKVQRGAPDDCWLWTGSRNLQGRGTFYWDASKQMVLAPRAAMWLAGVPLADNQLACHTCDNPGCVNPAHLYAGSSRENVSDALRRGRWTQRGKVGMEHGMAALTDADVYEIRRRLAAGERGTDIARDMGTTKSVVSQIKLGKTWKHLRAPIPKFPETQRSAH